MNKDNFFPIKTKTACLLKWTWSTIFLNDGTTSSCHRVGRHKVSLDNFENFHNTPEKIAQREVMLKGQWPQPLDYMHKDEGCRYCEKIEKAGGQSDRQSHLQIPNLSPKELLINPKETAVTPKILEVFLGNACNLACTYCGPVNSSKIQNENNKHGEFNKNGLILKKFHTNKESNSQYIEKFFSWLEKNSNELQRLHLLGGEPFYQKEFFRCVDFFEKHPNKNLQFNIVTNLMIDNNKLLLFLEQIKKMLIEKKIKRFDVTVSLDCLGPEQEYARWGINLKTMTKNIESLMKNKWIYLNINSTLSPLTIKTFPHLIKQINIWKKNYKINHHFQTVFSPEHHNPEIFGGEFWQEDLLNALSIMPELTPQEQNAKKYLNGISLQIKKSKSNPVLILKLITHLDELDKRRNTNWKIVFPWLTKFIN